MCRLRPIVASIIAFTAIASSASAQMSGREAQPAGAATASLRSAAERHAMARALLDSARQTLADGEAVLRAGDVARASARFAAARAMRSAVLPDPTLAPELAALDAALKNDADAVALGSSMLANAEVPPPPSASSTPPAAVPAAPSVASPDDAAARAATTPRRSVEMSRARSAALDSAAERNRRGMATSLDVTAPTPGLEEIGGRVLTIRTFESGAPPAPFGARKYQRTFETGATRYLYTEISIGFIGEPTTPVVELSCWTARDDSVLVRQPVQVSHASDASIFLLAYGIGWGEPSRLEPGRYATGCSRGGTPIVADSFTVTGYTARSAYLAASASAQSDDWPAAAAAYDSATRLDSTVALYHYGYGIALRRLHQDSAAADEYAAAIRLAPNEIAYHEQRASVLHYLRRFDDAAVEYRELVRLDSTNAQRHVALAALLLESGNRVGALAEYRKAAAMDPADLSLRTRIEALKRTM